MFWQHASLTQSAKGDALALGGQYAGNGVGYYWGGNGNGRSCPRLPRQRFQWLRCLCAAGAAFGRQKISTQSVVGILRLRSGVGCRPARASFEVVATGVPYRRGPWFSDPLIRGCGLDRPRRSEGDRVVALTLEAEQRLIDVGLVAFFEQHRADWLAVAQDTYTYLSGNFPVGSMIRRDDVAKALLPIVEVNEPLKEVLDERKLRGKFWRTFFTDLVVDRTWDELGGEQ